MGEERRKPENQENRRLYEKMEEVLNKLDEVYNKVFKSNGEESILSRLKSLEKNQDKIQIFIENHEKESKKFWETRFFSIITFLGGIIGTIFLQFFLWRHK